MENQNKELHRVVVTAIICKDGKYLITQRSLNKKAFPGRWNIPGGGVELVDYINTPKTTEDAWYYALETTLRREIREEVGLEIGKPKYLLDLAFIRPDDIPVITLSYYCVWESEEVKLNEECINYAWVTLEEAKKYDLISGVLEEIEMADKILKGGNPDGLRFTK